MAKDLTKTHSKVVEKDGKKFVSVKPMRIERTVNPDGSIDTKVIVPRLSIKRKRGQLKE